MKKLRISQRRIMRADYTGDGGSEANTLRQRPVSAHFDFAGSLAGSTGNALPATFGRVFRQTNQSSRMEMRVGNQKGARKT